VQVLQTKRPELSQTLIFRSLCLPCSACPQSGA